MFYIRALFVVTGTNLHLTLFYGDNFSCSNAVGTRRTKRLPIFFHVYYLPLVPLFLTGKNATWGIMN